MSLPLLEGDSHMHRFTRTRRRKVAAIGATMFILAVASASAYFLLLAGGSGSGSATLGKGSAEAIKLTATFANGLTPGQTEPVAYTYANATSHATDIRTLSVTPSIDAGHPGCNPAWFTLTGGSNFENLTGPGMSTPVAVAANSEGSIVGNTQITSPKAARISQRVKVPPSHWRFRPRRKRELLDIGAGLRWPGPWCHWLGVPVDKIINHPQKSRRMEWTLQLPHWMRSCRGFAMISQGSMPNGRTWARRRNHRCCET
jgi:hypothetical protein